MDERFVVEDDYFVRVGPARTLDNSLGPIEFNIEPSPLHLTDLSQSYLSLSLRVRRAGQAIEHCKALTGTHLTNPDTIDFAATSGAGQPSEDRHLSCVNNLFHSIFSQVSLELNGQLVERIHDYPFVAYLTNLFGFDKDIKNSALQTLIGWYPDEPGKFDSSSNSGHLDRIKHLLLNGKECHLKGRLALGSCEVGLLPNHTSLRILLHKNDASFPLLYTGSTAAPAGAYSIEITNCEFEVRRVGTSPSVLKDYESRLTKDLGEFDFIKSDCKAFTFSAQQSDITINNLFSGELPDSVLICLLPNATYHGDITKNPFNFQHFNMSRASLFVNGQEFPTPRGYDLKMSENKYADAYLNLFRGKPEYHGMTRAEFIGGSFFLIFDFHHLPGQQGVVQGKFKFESPLADTVTLLAIASYDVKFKMDQMRNLSHTYVP